MNDEDSKSLRSEAETEDGVLSESLRTSMKKGHVSGPFSLRRNHSDWIPPGKDPGEGRWAFVLQAMGLLICCFLGIQAAQAGISFVLICIVGILIIAATHYLLKIPFYKTFSIYIFLSAFNFYYFYMSAYTGRNPTDVGDLGIKATFMEQFQKDIVYVIIMTFAAIKLAYEYIFKGRFWHKDLAHPLLATLGFYGLFTLMRAAVSLVSGDSVFSVLLYARTNIEYAFIPLLFCTVLITQSQHLKTIFRSLMYPIPLVAGLGIAEFFTGGSPYIKIFASTTFHRAVSTLQNPNNLGAYLATGIGLYIITYLKKDFNAWECKLFWCTLPLGLICLFMTLSRSAILVFFTALTIIFFFMWLAEKRIIRRNPTYEAHVAFSKLKKKIFLIYGCILLFSIPILIRYFAFGESLSDANTLYLHSQEYRNARFFSLGPSLEQVVADPIHLLIGFSHSELEGWSDNVFSNVLLRSGLTGFISYSLIWMLTTFYSLRGTVRQSGTRQVLYLSCLYILTYQFFFSFAAPINQNFPHNLYFWVVVATILWLELPTLQDPYALRDTGGADKSLETD